MSSIGRTEKRFRSQLIAAAILAALLALFVSACGSSEDSTSDGATDSSSVAETPAVPCKGKPVVIGTITSLGGPAPLNDMMGGVEAAAQAVNHNCEAGRPIELVTCNDEGDQSRAADCGRQIVSEHATAIVGSGGIGSATFEPIVEGAGIPSIGNLSTDPTELAAPTSFPFYSGLTRIAARSSLHHAAGAKKVSIVLQDNPVLQTLLPTMEEVCESFGIEVEHFIPVPSNATDLAQYASQAAESESIMILVDAQAVGVLHELLNLGVSPETTVISAPTLSEDEIEGFGEQLNGLYMTSPTVPLNETSNEGVAQYLEETEAAGISDRGVDGIIAWRAMHVTAEVIKGLANPTPASVKKAMDAYSFSPPEAAPVNFTKPAFPEIKVFTEFRVFSREYAAWIVKDGKVALAAPPFLDPGSEFELES